ncbi:RNA-binding protein [Devosia epidermidihirudinis]|uniref:RNA-binding protein n=1 Tax=Devosia epidermidihirudinis TaxID=1293439 RepID=UPI000698D13B|nr:RNA-binding protein [Devosia epidermidihirudinis]
MARREETTRMCALTRAEKPVAELIRFVLGPDGVLVPDTDAKAEGRGVWLSLNRELVADAIKKKVFARSLKTEVTLPEDLAGLTQTRLEQRYLAALGMARKAGQLTFGATKVRGLIENGSLIALITATDAAEDGRSKMVGPLKALHYAAEEEGIAGFDVPHFELLSSEQMGLALGLENVIHAALTRGAAAQAAVEKARRLALYTAKPTETDTDRAAVDGDLLPEDQDERREIHG